MPFTINFTEQSDDCIEYNDKKLSWAHLHYESVSVLYPHHTIYTKDIEKCLWTKFLFLPRLSWQKPDYDPIEISIGPNDLKVDPCAMFPSGKDFP
jgi:hypothetical protein